MARVIFSEEDKALIRKLHEEEGISYAVLAKRYGVAPITINRICNPALAARQAAAREEYRKNNPQKVQDHAKKSYKQYSIRFHRTHDSMIIKHLDNKDNKLGYLRDLILADIQDSAAKKHE